LQTLRRELETRQRRLQSLTQRKQELNEQLLRLEAEKAAGTVGKRPPVAAAAKPPKKPPPPSPTPSQPGPPTLAVLIVDILRDIGGGLTVQQITEKVRQRGWATKSKALHKLVGKNVYSLVGKGTLRRPTGQTGFQVSTSANGKAASSAAKPI